MRDTIVTPDRHVRTRVRARRIGVKQRGTQRHRPTSIPAGSRTHPARAAGVVVGQPAGRFGRTRTSRRSGSMSATARRQDRSPTRSHPTPPDGRPGHGPAEVVADVTTTQPVGHRPADHRPSRPVGADLPRRPERRRRCRRGRDRRTGRTRRRQHHHDLGQLPQLDQPDRHLPRVRTSGPARRSPVVNLNNGHSVTCIATRVYSTAEHRPDHAHRHLRPDRRPHRRADPGRDQSVTHSRPAIRELLESNDLAPRRDLGQNFVADPNTVRRIADLARVGPDRPRRGDRRRPRIADAGARRHRRRRSPRSRSTAGSCRCCAR